MNLEKHKEWNNELRKVMIEEKNRLRLEYELKYTAFAETLEAKYKPDIDELNYLRSTFLYKITKKIFG